MAEAFVKVVEPGLYMSIQDLGRPGYQHMGVPVSGAMDRYALVMGNRLLNNREDSAAIEVTFGGAEFKFLRDGLICVTGANLNGYLGGEPIPMWETVSVTKGQKLVFERPKTGVRAYVCVLGGIQSSVYLGSQSCYEKAGLGRRLEAGDQLLSEYEGVHMTPGNRLSPELLPTYTQEVTLRVVPSHLEDRFTEESVRYFYRTNYTMKQGDRMGCRLESDQPLNHHTSADIISSVTPFGTIQVASNGQPMILLADRQTTGGYTTLGTIVTIDHWKIAQLPPGGKVNFKRVDLKEAEEWLRHWREA
ncbi:5-oxoprolinase subunit C family protein [Alkalibacillus aidingensis]|uniref:5-oxoprolinase subunit C family protein n=1 Tax=Alkalibacillus aidingensis TaxID=2747607 RepID=UPI001660367B|nr:biotin-dependent carboxyltransferase family protein [Alkalibacillus aidingensis]